MTTVSCRCGHSWEVPQAAACRPVACPGCGEPVLVEGTLRPGRGPLRHWPFTSLSGLGLLIAFFCLPWLRISCGGTVVTAPTGWNLAANSFDSTNIAFLKSKEPGVPPEDQWLMPDSPSPPWGSPTPELLALPALALVLLAGGAFRCFRPSPSFRRETLLAQAMVLSAGLLVAWERTEWYRKQPLRDLDSRRAVLEIRLADLKHNGGHEYDIGGTADELDYSTARDGPGLWLTLASLACGAAAMGAWLTIPALRRT